jgi:hypothetical protein
MLHPQASSSKGGTKEHVAQSTVSVSRLRLACACFLSDIAASALAYVILQETGESDMLYHFTIHWANATSPAAASSFSYWPQLYPAKPGRTWVLGCHTRGDRNHWMAAIHHAQHPSDDQVGANASQMGRGRAQKHSAQHPSEDQGGAGVPHMGRRRAQSSGAQHPIEDQGGAGVSQLGRGRMQNRGAQHPSEDQGGVGVSQMGRRRAQYSGAQHLSEDFM